LDDLPAGERTIRKMQQQGKDSRPHFNLSRVERDAACVNSTE